MRMMEFGVRVKILTPYISALGGVGESLVFGSAENKQQS